ncbi:PREDICTED: gastrula zinc finger protein XlCGF26.1-like [Papilio polytes]|uniref:gastrula zinc finger protein XlCGF26.1-like n=1 Tax=Papilio polytes TaxID=76194 RepID=UPI0006765106|nr:PREDICTED: gastrula zinc finger protein XlCGF26.1-like [Papilio polytes]
MEENAADLISPAIKNYNLKELKIVLVRNDCLINSYLNGTSKHRLKNNGGIKEEIKSKTGSKVRKKTQFPETKSDYEINQQSKLYNEKFSAYSCDVCGDTFQSMRALMHHTRFHIKSNGITFICAICGNKFNTNDELINHKLFHNSEDHSFNCKKCKKSFTDHHNYMQHNAKHVDTGIYKCIECSYTFNLRKSYKNHITTHYLRHHKCHLCKEIFTQPKDLHRHKKNYHYPGYDCVECGKHVQTQRDLDEHMYIHTRVKAFQCLYCGKEYTKHEGLRYHMKKMHTKSTPYECTICSLGFYNSTRLKSHMIVHDMKKKYECNDCGRQFFHRISMIQHTRYHMNYMLYKCPVCKNTFATYQRLLLHTEEVHMKTRNYKCDLCKSSFISKRGYDRHLGTEKHINYASIAKLGFLNPK